MNQVGRYELLSELGRGGMATVYLARQVDLDRLVALKELSAFRSADSSFARRFVREAQLAGSLSHPNIVTVYDYFVAEGTPYIAMEYLEHGTLRPHVGQMSLAEIGGVLEGVLSGLSLAEKRQIVHRDLKPENLLVAADGRVKIADFGIAKATNDLRATAALTSTGVAVGTPNYMAPEQATAQGVGPWTDLYSVGIMAFEFFVGRPPFGDTDNALGVLLRQVNEAIPPVSEVDDRVDPGISAWIGRMVAKEPGERPESAAAAWDELEDSFLALLGPRWRRAARLAILPGAPAPAFVSGFADAPTVSPGGESAAFVSGLADAPTARNGGGAPLATTLPPTVRPPIPEPATRTPPRARGRRLTKALFATVAIVAATAALLARTTGSGQQTSAGTATDVPVAQTTTPATTPVTTPRTPSSRQVRAVPLTSQATAAHKLANQYQSSATRVARLDGARVAGSPTALLLAALQRAAAAYRSAETAARAGDVPRYNAAIQIAEVRKADVVSAIANARAGDGGSSSQTAPPVARTPCSGDSVSDDPSDEDC